MVQSKSQLIKIQLLKVIHNVMEIETRIIEDDSADIRSSEESRTVEGFGIVFGKESKNLGGFVEVIDPAAANGVIETSDVFALLNHDKSKGVLARSNKGKGSMVLTIEPKGVKYRFDAPNFDLGNELLEGIRRKDITKSSFGFVVQEEKWTKRNNGVILRTILKFKTLVDMSPCYQEAYSNTSVAIRTFEEFRKSDNNEIITNPIKTEAADPDFVPIVEKVEKIQRSEKEIQLKRVNNIEKFKLKKL